MPLQVDSVRQERLETSVSMTYKSRLILKLAIVLVVMAIVGYGTGILAALLIYETLPWNFTDSAPSLPALIGLLCMIITVLVGLIWIKRSEKLHDKDVSS